MLCALNFAQTLRPKNGSENVVQCGKMEVRYYYVMLQSNSLIITAHFFPNRQVD